MRPDGSGGREGVDEAGPGAHTRQSLVEHLEAENQPVLIEVI